jgi:hypothetical protein
MKPVCFVDAGGDDPLSTGLFKLRRPHHSPELEQMAARGAELPDEDIEEEEE